MEPKLVEAVLKAVNNRSKVESGRMLYTTEERMVEIILWTMQAVGQTVYVPGTTHAIVNPPPADEST